MTDEPANKSDMAVTGLQFTAAQIETDCPARLQEIGKECAELLVQARYLVAAARKQVENFNQQAEETSKQFEEVEEQIGCIYDHIYVADKLFEEATRLCDDGGIDAFRQRFFHKSPQWLYQLHYLLGERDAAVESLCELAKRKDRSRAAHEQGHVARPQQGPQ
jgi:hypothetical protein